MFRKTLENIVTFVGVGVHSGKKVTIKLIPAEVGMGIVFKRVDVAHDFNVIKADYKSVKHVQLATILCNGLDEKDPNYCSVSTVEHLLSAMYACGISDLVIEIDGSEIPLMDGGASDFCFGMNSVGIKTFDITQKTLEIVRDIDVSSVEGSHIKARKGMDGSLKIVFTIDFPEKCIGVQTFTYVHSYENFINYIASAKTFGSIKDIEKARQFGMCLGGDDITAMIFDGENIVTKKYLYYQMDFVLHKILDFIGDISLSGRRITGEFACYKASHVLNNRLLEAVFSDDKNYIEC
jgi:UDP-3-O-[3-hydroxymyristoyl] N-acetylglucosamine deacetylase